MRVVSSAWSFVNEFDAQLRPNVGAGHFVVHQPRAHQNREVRLEVHSGTSRSVFSEGVRSVVGTPCSYL